MSYLTMIDMTLPPSRQAYNAMVRRPNSRWHHALDIAHGDPPYHYADRIARTLGVELARWSLNMPTCRPIPEEAQTAWRIYDQNQRPRHRLEALILARVPAERICERERLPAVTVKVYEWMFFDVRSALDVRDWVHDVVLNTFDPTKPMDDAAIWRRMAFLGGEHVFDAFYEVMTGGPEAAADPSLALRVMSMVALLRDSGEDLARLQQLNSRIVQMENAGDIVSPSRYHRPAPREQAAKRSEGVDATELGRSADVSHSAPKQKSRVNPAERVSTGQAGS